MTVIRQAYRERNRARINAQARRYRKRHREIINARRRNPVRVACRHCGVTFVAVPPNRKYCQVCSPPFDGYAKNILRNFDLSRPEWNAMYAAQGGVCAIRSCNKPATDVDHDHRTGRVRKLLCRGCNVQLGHLELDDWHAAALEYLRSWK